MDSFPVGARVYHIVKPNWGEGEIISSNQQRTVIKFKKTGNKEFETGKILNKVILTSNYSELPSNLQKDIKLRNEFYEQAQRYGLVEKLDIFQGEQLEMLVNIFIKLDTLDISSIDSISIDWLENEQLHALLIPIYEARYRSKRLPWDLVKLCKSLRKCAKQATAISYFESEYLNIKDNNKVLGALFTTIGGSCRDIEEFDKAWEYGLAAIQTSPNSYHPYNLLGGICYSKGNPNQGDHYFEKALELGADATRQSNVIKNALHNSSAEVRKVISEYLLKKDPHKFEWVSEHSVI